MKLEMLTKAQMAKSDFDPMIRVVSVNTRFAFMKFLCLFAGGMGAA